MYHADRQTNRQDGANSRFRQICDDTLKPEAYGCILPRCLVLLSSGLPILFGMHRHLDSQADS